MIFVDTNVFVIALRYPRDRHARRNTAFMRRLAERRDGVTSTVNLLELCGILSFNLNDRQLQGLFQHFSRRFGVRVLPEHAADASVGPASSLELLTWIRKRLAFGDALVADALARWAPETEFFVSWDASHFRGKVTTRVVTPDEALASW